MTEQEKKKKIALYENMIKKAEGDPSKSAILKEAQRKLDELVGKPAPEPTPEKKEGDGEVCTDAITEALNSIQEALELLEKGGSVNEDEVRRIFADSKVDLSQLSPEIIELINKNRKIVFEAPKRIDVEMEGEQPEIFWIAKSDLETSNNVYLYGGAGTGKTYISQQLAKALNCTLITINCNQYTSPLEIIGGQTIDGYQEGKLITAWANLTKGDDGVSEGMREGTTGCLLLLDELPKIDPNTAGLLNDALAKIKDTGEKSAIQNARGVTFQKKRFYCIATGNSKLNEESADYVANFRQDLSLQDRFAGSTYRIFVDLNVEAKLMQGFLFIFNFMNKVRTVIDSDEGIRRQLGSKAFVSIRIMESLRDTWLYWYENHTKGEVKTLKEGIVSFFDLFTQPQKDFLRQEVQLDKFFDVIENKKKQPLGEDSKADIDTAKTYVDEYNRKRELRRQGN
jgi:cobaltochelatase CobS